MTLTDNMCQEKKDVKVLSAFKTVLTHQYNDLKKKARRNTDYSHQKQYWQHEEQQNGNNQKTKIEEKQLYGRYKRLISGILYEKMWTWVRKGNL